MWLPLGHLLLPLGKGVISSKIICFGCRWATFCFSLCQERWGTAIRHRLETRKYRLLEDKTSFLTLFSISVWKAEWQKGWNWERSSIYWFIHQMLTPTRDRPPYMQETQTLAGSSTWTAANQVLGPPFVDTQGHSEEAGWEAEAGLSPKYSNIACRRPPWQLNPLHHNVYLTETKSG